MKDNLKKYGKYAWIPLIILLLLLCQPKTKKEVKAEPMIEPVKEETKKVLFQVDIKGAIASPGVYQMEEGSRVMDVITAAGGIMETSDTSRINLSKKITDEMVIILYTKEEIKKINQQNKIEYTYTEPKYNCPDSINQSCIEPPASEGEVQNKKVSLNHATLEELMTLEGIGESKAKTIIEHRKQSPFIKIEDLKEVKGIGDSVFEKIKESISI